MKLERLKEKIKNNPAVKRFVLNLLVDPVKTRPRLWLRMFMCTYIKRGKRSVIYRSVRKDIVPFNMFSIGNYSVIEDYSVINNMVGGVVIGDHTRIGIGNIIIGPAKIGSNVNLAQNITVSGLNHNYENVQIPISDQGVSTSEVTIEDDVWIGANSVITKGVKIGKHSVVAACSVVVRDVPSYSVVAGNPAKVIKKYNPEKSVWEKVL